MESLKLTPVTKLHVLARNLQGKQFSRLTVKSPYRRPGCSGLHWLCECSCGKFVYVITSNLTSGRQRSCGCYRDEEVHKRFIKRGYVIGDSKRPEWGSWAAMVSRCQDPNDSSYSYYGGRGIKVFNEWVKSFQVFLDYIGPKPSSDHSIDRFPDNDGNYEPGNVRWATRSEQRYNQSRDKRIEFRGEIRTISEWSRVSGICAKNIYYRLAVGWTVEEAITTKVGARRGQPLSDAARPPQ